MSDDPYKKAADESQAEINAILSSVREREPMIANGVQLFSYIGMMEATLRVRLRNMLVETFEKDLEAERARPDVSNSRIADLTKLRDMAIDYRDEIEREDRKLYEQKVEAVRLQAKKRDQAAERMRKMRARKAAAT